MPRGLGINELGLVRMVHDLDFGNDRLVFTVSRLSQSSDGYERNIWLFDGSLRQLTFGGSDFSPKLLNDGVIFLSRRNLGANEPGVGVWFLPFGGGEARRIALVRGGVEQLIVRGDKAFFISYVGVPSEDVRFVVDWPLWFNGRGFIHGLSPQLFSLGLDGSINQLTSGLGDVVAFDISPDGKKALVVVGPDKMRPYRNEIWLLDLTSGERSRVLSNYSVVSVTWSPSGDSFVFVGNDLHRGLVTHDHLFLAKLNGEVTDLIKSVDLDVGNSLNSDVRGSPPRIKPQWVGDYVYFPLMVGGRANLYRVGVNGGSPEIVVGGDRSIEDFVVLPNGTIYFIAMDDTRPTELFRLVDGREERLSDFNSWINNYDISKPERFSFRASDGVEIEGWLLRPVGFEQGKKYPVILEIHGGPKTAYGHAFMHEFHMLSSEGYAVVFMNPRGSDGYSEEFADIRGHYGERDYLDIMEGLDYVLKNYDFLDPNRVGVIGGSYGGFMTNWIITHTDRFKCAVTDRSISNWVSFFGTSDIGPWFANDQIGGGEDRDFLNNLDAYLAKSPIMYVRNVKTPLLIIHSLEDYRCWFDQAVQFYTALKYLGKEVKLAVFPGENHDLSRSGKPSHRFARLRVILDWFNSHLK